jgi:hypothetical protein
MAGPSLDLRQDIVDFARGCVGRVNFGKRDSSGRPLGIDFLKEIFRVSTGLILQDSDFKKKSGKGEEWTWLPSGKSWCGIFVVYCYRMKGITSVSWDLDQGKPVGDIKLTTWSKHWQSDMKIGDMGCVRHKAHHFLIADLPKPHSNRFKSIDGNGTLGAISENDPSKMVSGTHGFNIDQFNYYAFT